MSTVPLPVLFAMLGSTVPDDAKEACHDLKSNVVHTVNIGLEGTHLGTDRPMHWVYYPDDQTIFHRLSFPHGFSPWMVPSRCCSIQAEISESQFQPCDRDSIVETTLDGLVAVGLLTEQDIRPVAQGGRVRVTRIVTLDPAYIIYDLDHSKKLSLIVDYLSSMDIETCGRFGKWEYFNMDHSILSGKQAVGQIARQLKC